MNRHNVAAIMTMMMLSSVAFGGCGDDSSDEPGDGGADASSAKGGHAGKGGQGGQGGKAGKGPSGGSGGGGGTSSAPVETSADVKCGSTTCTAPGGGMFGGFVTA